MEPERLATSTDISPYHPGEQAIQERLGIRDKMDAIGRRFIRGYMPDQHRAFFHQLPFLMVGSLDPDGHPWASVVIGEPGFVTSPTPETLQVAARPLVGDPLNHHLVTGADLGLLGIELHTRRRNRVNGTLTDVNSTGFAIAVKQSFGNCPQYIQKRQYHWRSHSATRTEPWPAERFTRLSQPMQALLTAADTFFIASHYSEPSNQAHHGVDVSHRGGRPGFIRVESDRSFSFPDFTGNNFFNTLGNLLLDPRVGILLLDFAAGHVLSLTGQAEIIWEGSELSTFTGAERLVRIKVDEGIYLHEALPLRWEFQEYSPALEFTGTWEP